MAEKKADIGYIRKLKRAAEKKTGRYFRLQRPFGRLYDPL